MKAKQNAALDAAITKLRTAKDKIIALCENGAVITLDSCTLEKMAEFRIDGADFFRFTNGYDISYDGRYLAFGVKNTSKYQIWDIALKKKVLEVPNLHSSEVYAVRFSPYSMKLASGGMDGKSYVFDFETKQFSKTYDIRSDFISAFAFNPNGKQVAIAGFDNEIRLYKISDTESYISMVGLEEPIVRIEFVNEKEMVVFYREGQVLVFDSFTKKIIKNAKKLNDSVSAFEVSSGCIYICGRERNVRLLSASNFEELSEGIIKTQSIVSASAKQGLNELILGCLDGSVYRYDLDSDNVEFEEHLMNGDFAGAYALVESNPFLKQDYNYSILEEAWNMTLLDIIKNMENGKADVAKKMAQSFMQVGEKRLILQTLFKQFDEFGRFKYAIEHSNKELIKSLVQKNSYFKMTKLFEKVKNLF